jgi:hypothetical protein
MSDIVSFIKNYDVTDGNKNFSFEGFDKYIAARHIGLAVIQVIMSFLTF